MTLTSFLNYNRSISPSEGLLFGLVDGKEIPVAITEKTVRGSISNYIAPDKIKDPANPSKDQDPASPNIQRIDAAFLPFEAEALVLRYSLVIHGGAATPSGCDSSDVREQLQRIVLKAGDKGAFQALGERYAWNVVNARGLWRNRLARRKRVDVTVDDGETLSFESDNIETFVFPGAEAMPGEFAKLAGIIGDALREPRKALFLRVRVTGELPPGAEVFPSQEFTEEEKGRNDRQGKKSRVLSGRPIFHDGQAIRQASLHSQKLGNALRCIDDWHAQVDQMGVIAVETYGYSQGGLKTLRMSAREEKDGKQGVDFYSLLGKLPEIEARIDSAKEGALPNEILYFLAVLVRGGVFSGGKREKN